MINIMSFAGCEVRIVKNCHRGLEYVATEILSKKAKIREADSTAITFSAYRTARETQDYMPLQLRATNNLTNSHNFKILIEFTYTYLQ